MWRRLTSFDRILIVLAVLTALAYLLLDPSFASFLLWSLGGLVFIRLFIILKRKMLWKIRNRLIFSSVFFVVAPILLVGIFFLFLIYILIAQYGVIIIDNLVKRQLTQYSGSVDNYLLLNDREKMQTRVRFVTRFEPENLVVAFYEKNADNQFRPFYKYPSSVDFKRVQVTQFSGYFKIDRQLYLGAFKQNDQYAVLLAMHLNEDFIGQLSRVSDFKIKMVPDASPGNTIDSQISLISSQDEKIILMPWQYKFKYIDFDSLESRGIIEREHFFWLLIDYDKIFEKIRILGKDASQINAQRFIYFLIGLFTTFIIISFFIGFRIIRVITKSINQLTQATKHVRRGDFDYRIRIKSGGQLQYLADSFNEMAAGIKRLLREEKKKQQLEGELRTARSIQLKLLPPDHFSTPEFEISSVNIPAQEIAGDYFDYFYHPGRSMTMLVADVSGKGASAAFYMAELKGVINYLQKLNLSPADLISECHVSLSPSFDKVTFITMSLATFSLEDNSFVFSRAGHTQGIYYVQKKGVCIELFPEGVAIGLRNFTRNRIAETRMEYGTGDILFLFSDGLSEIMNKEEEMLGVENLKRILCDSHRESAEEIKSRILDFSIRYSQKKSNRDDLTFMILKVK